MDSGQKEQAFDTITTAFCYGYVRLARFAFYDALETACEEKQSQTIKKLKAIAKKLENQDGCTIPGSYTKHYVNELAEIINELEKM